MIPNEITALIQSDIGHFDHHFRARQVLPNLSREEVRALEELSKNVNIVIKPADKGSAIVILDRGQYLWEGYRQLNDTTYYTKLTSPIYHDTIPLIN